MTKDSWRIGVAGLGTVGSTYYDNAVGTNPGTGTKEDLFAFYAGTGQMFHLSQNFLVRWDINGAFYSALYDNKTKDKATFSNWNFGIGIGFKL